MNKKMCFVSFLSLIAFVFPSARAATYDFGNRNRFLALACQRPVVMRHPRAIVPVRRINQINSLEGFSRFLDQHVVQQRLHHHPEIIVRSFLEMGIRFSASLAVFEQVQPFYKRLFAALQIKGKEIPDLLNHSPFSCITRLKISWNSEKDPADGEIFKVFPRLTDLEISCNHPRVKRKDRSCRNASRFSQSLSPMLEKAAQYCQGLQKLSILGWRGRYEENSAFPKAVFSNLKDLTIQYERDKGATSIDHIAASQFPQLERLNIDLHRVKSISSLKDMTSLKALSLRGDLNSGKDGPALLGFQEVVPTLLKLETLIITGNHIENLFILGDLRNQIRKLGISPYSATEKNRQFILHSMPHLKELELGVEHKSVYHDQGHYSETDDDALDNADRQTKAAYAQDQQLAVARENASEIAKATSFSRKSLEMQNKKGFYYENSQRMHNLLKRLSSEKDPEVKKDLEHSLVLGRFLEELNDRGIDADWSND